MSSIVDKLITLDDVTKPMKCIPISDIHLGANGVHKRKFNNLIEWIKNEPNCYVVGLGDYCDCITIKDKRFDIKSVDKSFLPYLDNLPMAQLDYLKKALNPIKDKILCLIPGNHEDKMRTEHSIDIMGELKRDGYQIGDYMTFLRLKFNREQFHTTPIVMWLHHGWFSGRKMGGKINQLMDVASTYDADIFLTGHSHDLFGTTLDKISIGSNSHEFIKQKKIFGNTGTFLETTVTSGGSYSERKAYPVAKIGTLSIDIYPNHRHCPDIHVRV